jgi:hypothetical protein
VAGSQWPLETHSAGEARADFAVQAGGDLQVLPISNAFAMAA